MSEHEQAPKEQYANWKAPESTGETEIKEKIAERLAQSFSSRLCEYLTGLKPEDPRMLERLRTDQSIVRAKYNLPDWNLVASETEHALMEIAERFDVRIKPKSECGKFFEENPFVGAVHFDDGKIGTDIDRTGRKEYQRSLDTLEHELVHAMQSKKSPSMPIELSEYEAYVSGANIEYLKKNPEAVDEIFYNFLVGSSVNMYYRLESERRGEKISPEWDNAEYFLKRDGIDISGIETKSNSDQ
ncbi:MAG: hypothetical protein KW804_01580 [Candidatus Doudnabacteria bacterium]|nr:hypothetical protein [Candidatus Doudnabacteria bacterium]